MGAGGQCAGGSLMVASRQRGRWQPRAAPAAAPAAPAPAAPAPAALSPAAPAPAGGAHLACSSGDQISRGFLLRRAPLLPAPPSSSTSASPSPVLLPPVLDTTSPAGPKAGGSGRGGARRRGCAARRGARKGRWVRAGGYAGSLRLVPGAGTVGLRCCWGLGCSWACSWACCGGTVLSPVALLAASAVAADELFHSQQPGACRSRGRVKTWPRESRERRRAARLWEQCCAEGARSTHAGPGQAPRASHLPGCRRWRAWR